MLWFEDEFENVGGAFAVGFMGFPVVGLAGGGAVCCVFATTAALKFVGFGGGRGFGTVLALGRGV